LFVIIKLEFPPNFLHNAPSSSGNDIVQVEEHEANNEGQVNDPIKEDENNNIVQDDGTNKMIQELFAQSDEDGDGDGIYDESLIEKENKRLYKASRANLHSSTLSLVNLKVMNHFSNTCMA
jgi:hypothetical protein